MWSNVKNIFKVADLRNKVLFTLAMIAVYRFGTALRVPGVDAQAVSQLREASNSQGALGFLNLFSGGAFGSFSIFALGIMPYITASIIMQVLGVVIQNLSSGSKKVQRVSARSRNGRAIWQSASQRCKVLDSHLFSAKETVQHSWVRLQLLPMLCCSIRSCHVHYS